MGPRKSILLLCLLLAATCSRAADVDRLASNVVPCPVETESIGGAIAVSVVSSLLSGVIDSVVQYLGTDQVERYTTILPTDEIGLVLSGKDCIRVKSPPDADEKDAKFLALFKLDARGGAVKPRVLQWTYPHGDKGEFLTKRCHFLLSCDRRDVAIVLEIFSLGSSFAASIAVSTPIDMTFQNVTADEIAKAFSGKDQTSPWVSLPSIKGPANIKFTLVETMRANALSKALGSAIAGQKGALLAKVTTKLDGTADSVAAQAAVQDIAAAATAQAAYVSAWNAAHATQESFALASTPSEKSALRATYLLQVADMKAKKSLASYAFKVAGISGPEDLGALPSSL